MVDVLINGVRVAKATKYDYEEKYDNTVDDTFDGKDVSQGEYPEYSVSVSRISTVNSNYESILADAIKDHPEGIPITIIDGVLTVQFTGCLLEDRKVSRDPKKKRNMDISFKATGMTEKYN